MSIAALRRYGIFGALRLARDLLYTRAFYRGARIVRMPTYIRGFRHVRFGEGLTTGVGLRIDAFPEADEVVVHIGAGVQVNDYVHIAAVRGVFIGEDTLIASKVFITDHNHGDFRGSEPENAPTVAPVLRPLMSNPVHIGRRVWIGEHVCIMPGVRIGDGAVIGAGAVVTKDIPENCVAVGAPARVIRRYDFASRRWIDPQPG